MPEQGLDTIFEFIALVLSSLGHESLLGVSAPHDAETQTRDNFQCIA